MQDRGHDMSADESDVAPKLHPRKRPVPPPLPDRRDRYVEKLGDGELAVGQILGALAVLLDDSAATLRSGRLGAVRELVTDGFLLPG